MDSLIGIRLKAYRKRTGTKMPSISRAISIPPETLYKWEKGTKPSDINEYMNQLDYLNKHDILSEHDPTFIEKMMWAYQIKVPSNITLREVFNTEIDTIITCTEDCMLPDFKPGSKLCLRQVPTPKTLVWGEVYYFIDINKKGMLRGIYASEAEEIIRLISNDKEKYPEVLRRYDELEAVFEIAGVILK